MIYSVEDELRPQGIVGSCGGVPIESTGISGTRLSIARKIMYVLVAKRAHSLTPARPYVFYINGRCILSQRVAYVVSADTFSLRTHILCAQGGRLSYKCQGNLT